MEKPDVNLYIEQLQPLRKGGLTWMSFYRIFYYTRLFRYIHFDQYALIPGIQKGARSLPKLKQLCNLGFLNEVSPNVFAGTSDCQKFIERKWLSRYIPNVPDGEGHINALNNTEVFIQAIKLPDFYDIIFPEYGYIDPDAMLIRKRDGKYKLTFLEVEASKKRPDWLEDKRENYLRLAKDIEVYNRWKEMAKILKLRIPTIQEFKFDVTFICTLTKNFERGFNFLTSLNG